MIFYAYIIVICDLTSSSHRFRESAANEVETNPP